MKYPIDAEKYISALRLEFGPVSECRAEAYREVVRLVNMCYADGLQNKSGYPLDPDEECLAFAEASGEDLEGIRNNPLLPRLIRWCNEAYEQGRKEATDENQI